MISRVSKAIDPIAITIYAALALGIAFVAVRRLRKGRPSIFEQARRIPPPTGLLTIGRAKRAEGTTDASADAGEDADTGAMHPGTAEAGEPGRHGDEATEEERARDARRR